MPCDQVRTVSVAWSEATDLKLVASALQKVGATQVTLAGSTVRFVAAGRAGSFANGQLNVAREFNVNALKQEYACEVIADRFEAQGWDVQETTSALPAWARS